jgi:predicted permease
MLQALRYAARTLRKSPSFTTVALLTLALGVGANTAMFSVVNGILLRPLDYRNASRIVHLNTSEQGRVFPRVTGPDLVDIRSEASALEQVAFYYGGDMGVQLAGHAEFAATYLVSPNFFSVFGAAAVFGRTFEDPDARRAAVVGLSFAQRNFGSASAALGRTIRFEGMSLEIVGVAPAAFHFPREAQVWIAVSPRPESMERTAYNYRAVALVKEGTTIDAADAQLKTIGSRLEAAFPDSNRSKTFVAAPLQEQLVGPVRGTLYFLMGAVSLVLLIACANVANLLLARATARQREMAVRAALGATGAALMRQLLVESGVLALTGGGLGLVLASVASRAFAWAGAQTALPRVDEIDVNWHVFAFALAVSLAASVLFGISPALHAARADLSDALKSSGRGVAGSSNRLRNALVVLQVALSFALTISAGLMFRSVLALNAVNLGFRTDGLLVMQAHHPARTLDDHLEAARFFDRAADQMREIPGVAASAAAMGVPAGQYGSNGAYVIDGQDFRHLGPSRPQANFTLATGGYFASLGIPLVAGRDFNSSDSYDRPFVAIISESLARLSFPGQDPIGHIIMCGLDSLQWMTIVGVVADVRQNSPASSFGPTLYMPLLQHPFHANEVQLVMRGSVPPIALVEPARAKMRALNADVATRFETMGTMLSDSIATPRLRMTLVGLFAGLALLVSMAGVYGVISYVAAQRIPEFGVRMALGASPRNVMGLVLGRASAMTAGGALAGLALAFAAARVLNTMLFGVEATDAVTYGAVFLGVTPIVVLAAVLPAWRAAHADPLTALRNE